MFDCPRSCPKRAMLVLHQLASAPLTIRCCVLWPHPSCPCTLLHQRFTQATGPAFKRGAASIAIRKVRASDRTLGSRVPCPRTRCECDQRAFVHELCDQRDSIWCGKWPGVCESVGVTGVGSLGTCRGGTVCRGLHTVGKSLLLCAHALVTRWRE